MSMKRPAWWRRILMVPTWTTRVEQDNAALRRRLAEVERFPPYEKKAAARDAALLRELWRRHSQVRIAIEPGFGTTNRSLLACEGCNRYWPCPDAQLLLRNGQVEPEASATWDVVKLTMKERS